MPNEIKPPIKLKINKKQLIIVGVVIIILVGGYFGGKKFLEKNNAKYVNLGVEAVSVKIMDIADKCEIVTLNYKNGQKILQLINPKCYPRCIDCLNNKELGQQDLFNQPQPQPEVKQEDNLIPVVEQPVIEQPVVEQVAQ